MGEPMEALIIGFVVEFKSLYWEANGGRLTPSPLKPGNMGKMSVVRVFETASGLN
jgi:hypothetical protein